MLSMVTLMDELLCKVWFDAFFGDRRCMPVNKKIRSVCWIRFFTDYYPKWCIHQINAAPKSKLEFSSGILCKRVFASEAARKQYEREASLRSFERTANLAMITIVSGNSTSLAFEEIYRTCYNIVIHELRTGAHKLHAMVFRHLAINYEYIGKTNVYSAVKVAELICNITGALTSRVCMAEGLTIIHDEVHRYKVLMKCATSRGH